jgi:hypothetical protein
MGADWVRAELTRTLALLAASAEQQLAYLKQLGGSNDELGLEFDDVAGAAARLPTMSPDLAVAVGTISDTLKTMSGSTNAELWTDEAIRSDARWEHVRELAKKALALHEDTDSRRQYSPT